jgi:adenylate kinase family enzyme
MPVVEYYRQFNIVSTIDGNGTPEETYALVKAAVTAAL